MRRLLVSTVALLALLPAATASAEPTLTLEEDCTSPNGLVVTLSGFPANTPFHGTLVFPDGHSISADLETDASGNFSIGPFVSPIPGTYTATIEWSGPTLVRSLEVDCPSGRMVGKGTVTGGGVTASYAYILRCPLLSVLDVGPFEVRFGTQSFRLGSAPFSATVGCSDDPTVPTPAAGFDTQTGFGVGTLSSGGTPVESASINWKFVDGGPGGANDSVEMTITSFSGPVVFNGTASPPGKFPGSTQTTGNNTAQLLP